MSDRMAHLIRIPVTLVIRIPVTLVIRILVTLVISTVPLMEANECPSEAHPVCSCRPAEEGFAIIIDCSDRNLENVPDLSDFQGQSSKIYISSMA